MKNTTKLLLACLLAPLASASMMGPWDLDKLFRAPSWEKTETAAQPGMTEILYSSLPYEGKPVQVFAYYKAPEGTPPEGGWPAVVCVHGGGGTAFNEWVQRWNDHGYAAISMDLEGHYPIKEVGDGAGPRRSTENPGPSRVGVFGDFEKPIEQQWYYHAVAQVVLAHSLIRSFPEVNVDKIGITGISWGGTLTSTVMGVDNRFKFAIPVHGQLRICPGGAKRLFSGVRPLPGHLENKEVDVILPWYITSHDRQRLPSSNSWWLLRSSQF